MLLQPQLHGDFIDLELFYHILDLNSLTHSITIRWRKYLVTTIWIWIWTSYLAPKKSVLFNTRSPGSFQLPESIFIPNGNSKINAIKANQKGELFPKQIVKHW